MAEKNQEEKYTSFWADEDAAIEVGIDLPQGQRALSRACRNFTGYTATKLKQGRAEVSMAKLTPIEKERMLKAKDKEVTQYIAEKVVSTLPPGIRPPPERIMKMRWF